MELFSWPQTFMIFSSEFRLTCCVFPQDASQIMGKKLGKFVAEILLPCSGGIMCFATGYSASQSSFLPVSIGPASLLESGWFLH